MARTERRHPAAVTADRLHAALGKWPGAFDERAFDEVEDIIDILDRIAQPGTPPAGEEASSG